MTSLHVEGVPAAMSDVRSTIIEAFAETFEVPVRREAGAYGGLDEAPESAQASSTTM